ncbi:MAG: hypothetical protein K5929_07645, partial [Lachnospiraceae bacterium]|nr:hypothetical protein [Lachnospiraceae bacterium]
SDLKGAYDESLPADRAARDALIGELNINLYYAVKEYVSGKEKVRTTTNGQKRFGDALDAISILASFTPGMKHNAMKPLVWKKICYRKEYRKLTGSEIRSTSIMQITKVTSFIWNLLDQVSTRSKKQTEGAVKAPV